MNNKENIPPQNRNKAVVESDDPECSENKLNGNNQGSEPQPLTNKHNQTTENLTFNIKFPPIAYDVFYSLVTDWSVTPTFLNKLNVV